ncbi:hypothetical protein [Nocardia sp. NPDC059195]|uniref:hypothetical protein n=1 Tax=Nocardia sp. NPDC059195 TaxID=3346765 RepID=UPI00368E3809
MTTEPDRYDPTGAAAIWDRAAELVTAMRDPELSTDWNTGLEQAARALNNESRGIRQDGGMYYRTISGTGVGVSSKSDGAAAIWDRAAELVTAMRDPELPTDWNTALEQAARVLNNGSHASTGTGPTS